MTYDSPGSYPTGEVLEVQGSLDLMSQLKSSISQKSLPGAFSEQEAIISKRVDKVPPRFRKSYRRALEGKASPRQAIKSKCEECCGCEDATNRIRECRIYHCPLWSYRPYQSKESRHGI